MSRSVSFTHWTTTTGPNAICMACELGIYGNQNGSPGPEARRIYRWAREHARLTGHRVQIEHGQVAYMEPDR